MILNGFGAGTTSIDTTTGLVGPSAPAPYVPASTAAATPSYAGNVDVVDCNHIAGWVTDRNRPDAPLPISVVINGNIEVRVMANGYRPDLKMAGWGNGEHAFDIPFPAYLKDGRVSSVAVFVEEGGGWKIGAVDRSVTCGISAMPGQQTVVTDPTVELEILVNNFIQVRNERDAARSDLAATKADFEALKAESQNLITQGGALRAENDKFRNAFVNLIKKLRGAGFNGYGFIRDDRY